MTPPPHICGPLPRGPSVATRDRTAWISSQVHAGVLQKDIAIALGVSAKSVMCAMDRARHPPRCGPASFNGPGRYSVTGFVRGAKHASTIRAADRAAAEDRFRRAYPGAEVVRAERLRE